MAMRWRPGVGTPMLDEKLAWIYHAFIVKHRGWYLKHNWPVAAEPLEVVPIF